VSAVKSAADGFGEGSVDDDDEQSGEELASFEDDRFADGEFTDVIRFALPFAPMHESKTFAEGSEEHDRKEIGDEDVKDTPSGIDDAFPGSSGGKDQEQSVKHARKGAESRRYRVYTNAACVADYD
jgi:hypothetical protein